MKKRFGMKKIIATLIIVSVVLAGLFATENLGLTVKASFGPDMFKGSSPTSAWLTGVKQSIGHTTFGLTFGASYEIESLPVDVYMDLGFAVPSRYKITQSYSGSTIITGERLGEFKFHLGALYALEINDLPVDIKVGGGLAVDIYKMKEFSETGNIRESITSVGLALYAEADYALDESLGLYCALCPDFMFSSRIKSKSSSGTNSYGGGAFGFAMAIKAGATYKI